MAARGLAGPSAVAVELLSTVAGGHSALPLLGSWRAALRQLGAQRPSITSTARGETPSASTDENSARLAPRSVLRVLEVADPAASCALDNSLPALWSALESTVAIRMGGHTHLTPSRGQLYRSAFCSLSNQWDGLNAEEQCRAATCAVAHAQRALVADVDPVKLCIEQPLPRSSERGWAFQQSVCDLLYSGVVARDAWAVDPVEALWCLKRLSESPVSSMSQLHRAKLVTACSRILHHVRVSNSSRRSSVAPASASSRGRLERFVRGLSGAFTGKDDGAGVGARSRRWAVQQLDDIVDQDLLVRLARQLAADASQSLATVEKLSAPVVAEIARSWRYAPAVTDEQVINALNHQDLEADDVIVVAASLIGGGAHEALQRAAVRDRIAECASAMTRLDAAGPAVRLHMADPTMPTSVVDAIERAIPDFCLSADFRAASALSRALLDVRTVAPESAAAAQSLDFMKKLGDVAVTLPPTGLSQVWCLYAGSCAGKPALSPAEVEAWSRVVCDSADTDTQLAWLACVLGSDSTAEQPVADVAGAVLDSLLASGDAPTKWQRRAAHRALAGTS